MAGEGVLFTNAFTSSNLCAPSRIGIATGNLQNRLGYYRNDDSDTRGMIGGTTLASGFQDAGYATAHIGKWHIGQRDESILEDLADSLGLRFDADLWRNFNPDSETYRAYMNSGYLGSVNHEHHPLQNGFDYYYGYNYWASQFYNSTLVWENYMHAGKQMGYNTDVFTEKALEFITSAVGDENPFYVQLHYHAVHDSLEPKAPSVYFEKFNSASYDLNNFYAHLNAVDVNVSKILDYLESVNQLENTMIIFTSDNGGQVGGPSVLPGNAPFTGQKGNGLLGGMKVPFFVYWPAGVKEGRELNHLVSTLDILPTMLDAAGGVAPDQLDGKSLLPLIKGENDQEIHDYLLWSGVHSRFWGFMKYSVIGDPWDELAEAPSYWAVIGDGYILRHTGEIAPGLYTDMPDGASATTRLFRYQDDPAEMVDLSQEMTDKVRRMKEIYFENSDAFPQPFTHVEKWK